MPAYNLAHFVAYMESWGLTDVLLPFLLYFIVIFAVFQKAKVLGDKKNMNVGVAIVIALLVVIPHVIYGTPMTTDGRLTNGLPDIVEITNNALPQVVILLLGVLMVLMLLGAIGAENSVPTNSWVVGISFLLILYIFGGAAGWWAGSFFRWVSTAINTDVLAILVILLIFGILIWFVTKDEGGDPSAPE